MTSTVLKKWLHFADSLDAEILMDLLDENVIFHSPIVHKPQKGKMLTGIYLLSAAQTFAANKESFKYVREVVNEEHIILEFNAMLEGIFVNGVDMIKINSEGKIQEFKVMIRPLKGINIIHNKMAEMIQKMGG